MEILKNLELVNVEFEDKKATLTFLDEERGEIREVNFNKKTYDQETGKYVDDQKKAEKVEEWCQEIFGLPFDRLAEAIGERRDVYVYDRFNSLFEVDIVEKFTVDDEGLIFETVVDEVEDDGIAVRIKFKHEGKQYESRMSYADYLETKKQWFVNPQKQRKQYEKFEEKFGITIDQKDELVGKKVMVEVKMAFGKFPYAEIKSFPKAKKK